MHRAFLLCGIWLMGFGLTALAWGQGSTGRIEISIVEKSTGQPLSCRLHVKDAAGKPQRAGQLPYWHDHFVCPGLVRLELPPGRYTYEIERGPEYRAGTGSFTITAQGDDKLSVSLERLADLAAEGWWSGELHVHRPIEEIELLLRAEDLHIAPVITWWNNRNLWDKRKLPERLLVPFDGSRFYDVMAGEDEREGGALLYFHLPRPLAVTGSSREYPSPMKFVTEARRQSGVWIDIEKPFWWDVPVWVASGQIDSIGLANNHMCRSQMYENEAWGKPRDSKRLPAPVGNGYWSQEIYYHLLNCGLRLPPSAGSASGVLPNPVGYNRVYVHVGPELSYEKWWEALRAGRSFVTNGPLLRTQVAGKLPGHVFTAAAGEELNLDLQVTLSGRDPIRFVEVIHNGQVERRVPFEEWARNGLSPLRVKTSGWFLVRVLADNPRTFRFASTAPYYVEIGPTRQRISKTAAQFFLDWAEERSQRVKLEDAAQRQEVLHYHTLAKKYWQDLVNKANAE